MSEILDQPLVIARSAVAREIDGNFTLYDKQNDSVMVFNDSASAIWRLCDGRTGSAIVDELARHYTAPRSEIERDVEAALERLMTSGVLVHDVVPS